MPRQNEGNQPQIPQIKLLRLIVSAQSNLGLSPSDFTDALGISSNTWYQRRKDLDKMTLGELRALRKVMGMTAEQVAAALDI